MVDDERAGDVRVDLRRVSPTLHHGVAHGREVHEDGHAREVLEEDASRHELDLGALLAGIVERQRQRGQTIRFSAAELPELRLSPRALTRAIGNLIDNATKYGGGEIAVSASRQANEIWIEVRDQGAGIPATGVERLKRPFTRLDSARSNATGTGLGLAIVDRIARLHDGRLELLPNPDGGLLARLVIVAATG